MVDELAEQARKALVALADLCSSREEATAPGSIPLDWFRWLPAVSVRTLVYHHRAPSFAEHALNLEPTVPLPISVDRPFGERLAAVDQLRPGRRSLRIGWLFVTGTSTTAEGRSRRVFWPLVSRPVSVVRSTLVGPAGLVPAGDVELTRMISDAERRSALEAQIEFGGGAIDGWDVAIPAAMLDRLARLRAFAVAAAEAAGIPATRLIPAGESPDVLKRRDELVIVAGVAVYANTETGGLSHAASLDAWARRPLRSWTAFHSLYADETDQPEEPPNGEPIESPYLLTPVQRSAVQRSRTARLTVVKGAPGTGKSHTITAIACDALARGDTVLVTAKSDATVDALLDLFDRAPGPRPVVFGSNERKDALAEHLAGGLHPSDDGAVERARTRLVAARERRDALRGSIAARLATELITEAPTSSDEARLAFPQLFDPRSDLDALDALLRDASSPTGGWTARRHRRKASAALEATVGPITDEQLQSLSAALVAARAAREVNDLTVTGGLVIGSDWTELREADDEVHVLAAEWLELESRSSSRLDRRSLGAVAALATALRSGRAARREQLSRLDDHLTRALPLWAGTLPDIDDLLPSSPGLFDLVILDEASSIDQPAAASALLRGKRAVIVGDPRQLRHVSFLSDEQRDRAIADAGIDLSSPLAARLDVRRNSAFDLAASAAPVFTLNEHFRCRPHLVEFVARRLYDGQVQVATRSPATASVDCIDLRRVAGVRDTKGVVHEEVKAVLAQLRDLRRRGARSVGVVTPFRRQADALEDAILGAFTLDEIEALDLRVGTVHAFQGNERDTIVASLGLDGEPDAASWRFVEDPHLFTVFVTRARDRFVIIHSADPPPVGLASEYFAQANDPPGPPRPVDPRDEWTSSIARHLSDAGVEAITGYATGRHHVDICVGNTSSFYGVECAVHPEGPDAHIERHLSLDRRGWELREAYPTRWGDRLGELIVELTSAPPWVANDGQTTPHR